MLTDTNNKIILHAPRVHTGGGYILLQQFINKFFRRIRYANLDKRVQKNFDSLNINKKFVNSSIIALLMSEYNLFSIAKPEDIVLSFHGLPPIFSLKGRIIVFAQNSLLFDPTLYKLFSFKTKIKLYIERWWFKFFFRSNVEFIVQTNSMKKAITNYLGQNIKITIDSIDPNIIYNDLNHNKIYDFIYIASGEPHKNHLNLLNAWKYLAKHNIKPSLILTIDDKHYPELAKTINYFIRTYNVSITNIGFVKNIGDFLIRSNALIYPSLSESLGLPLLEAKELGIPILASDKEFVFDSITPSQIFDPLSDISIANAVKRFIKTTSTR